MCDSYVAWLTEFIRKHGHKNDTVSKAEFKKSIDKCVADIIKKVEADLQKQSR